MEFPRSPTKREKYKRDQVSLVISGLQDICLSTSIERVDELLEQDGFGYNYPTYVDDNDEMGTMGQ